ncbi:MAG: metallophosphoesterase family protein [Candidatus Helarchaeota archaeon]
MKRNYSVLIAVLVFSISFLAVFPNNDLYESSMDNIWNGRTTIETHHTPGHLSNESKIFWFVHISDVHINSFEKIFGVQSEIFSSALNDINNYIKPEFIIDTGDLVNGLNPLPYYQDPDQWKIYWEVLQETGMNESFYYDVIGNHDGYGNSDTFSYFLNWSMQKKLQYTFNRTINNSNYTFIVLNSVWSNGAEWPDGTSAELDTSEMDWFESQLIKYKDSNLTFVFHHHPYWELTDFKTSSGTSFLELLQEYNVSVDAFGHGHEDLELNQGGTICIETGSLGQGGKSIRIFAVDNDGVSTKVGLLDKWPIALITTPMDRDLSRTAYNIPNNSKAVPIRALVFDKNNLTSVQFNIDNGPWISMTNDISNKFLWKGFFDATILSNGVHRINLKASSPSGTDTDSISIYIGIPKAPEIINGKLNNVVRFSDSDPLYYNISMHKWDPRDSKDKLNWSVSNVDPSFCLVEIIDNDTLVFTPNLNAHGTKTITITLTNTHGLSVSTNISITIYYRVPESLIKEIIIISLFIALICSVLISLFRQNLASNKKSKIK